MPKALGALIAVTCIAVLAATGWYLYSERQEYLAAEKKAAADAAQTLRDIERLKATADRLAKAQHIKSLTPELCNRLAVATLPASPGKPPKTNDHIEDLKICDDNGRLGSYERHQLDLSGVF